MTVMRHDKDRTAERGKRDRERFAGFHVEMVSRFVEHEKIRFFPGDEGKRETGFFAARHRRHEFIHLVARKTELAEKIAKLLLTGIRGHPSQMLKRCFIEPQGIQLVLGKVADRESLAASKRAGHERELTADSLHEG